MSDDDKSSKTEDASAQKLKKARDKGDVPITKEPGHLGSYLAVLAVLSIVVPTEVPKLAAHLSRLINDAPALVMGDGMEGMADLRNMAMGPIVAAAAFLAKVMAVFGIGALFGAGFMGPFLFAAERIRPKFSKISPMKGAKRLAGAQNLVEFGKNLVKLVVLIGMTTWLVWDGLMLLLPGSNVLPEVTPAVVVSQASTMLVMICVIMFPIAIADYAWKRFSHLKKQRMSMKEVKDEHKDSDGDPHIKGKRDQIRRARARARLATAVPTATLIVTNPTHYAVALRYERGADMAPVCVAKGADLMAARIRTIAHENGIPVIESVALARALHATVEVDSMIPEAHWGAVAELVGFVYDLRNKVRRKLPEGAQLRED